jgi:hypothetical protein
VIFTFFELRQGFRHCVFGGNTLTELNSRFLKDFKGIWPYATGEYPVNTVIQDLTCCTDPGPLTLLNSTVFDNLQPISVRINNYKKRCPTKPGINLCCHVSSCGRYAKFHVILL